MSSPAEFLTFYRRAGMAAARCGTRVPAARPAGRWIATSARRGKELSTDGKVKTDLYPDDKHSVDKAKDGDDYDVQTANVKGGMDSAKKSGTGGHATEGRDSAGGKEKAKKEFPEAPDPAIGMQDERGGRGG